MSIFASSPEVVMDTDLKVLFLHGLEGSTTGAKATHLKNAWKAQCPKMRTHNLKMLKSSHDNIAWSDIGQKKVDAALSPAYSDACDAVRYLKPDIIVGSSLGGAILAKMVIENVWSGNCVFLAPAIKPILGNVKLPQMPASVWVLGECDEVVPNSDNIRYAASSLGQLIVSCGDSHRLHLALENNLIDSAIATSLEISNHM